MQEINTNVSIKILTLCVDDTQSAFFMKDTVHAERIRPYISQPFCPLAVISDQSSQSRSLISDFTNLFNKPNLKNSWQKLVIGKPEYIQGFCVRSLTFPVVSDVWKQWHDFRFQSIPLIPQLKTPSLITGMSNSTVISDDQNKEIFCSVFYLSVMEVFYTPNFCRWNFSAPTWFSLR